ncbi:hypothetical protein EVAR_86411_1 [Eumeta japonica]|uniref:Uncharacterized protein n=1 Tax=Eumeta variegata TaxID=151549 RepID=A0A4C1W8V3_EUMVA|nr:hypothetical protein EVAR_86411_1 [Eumeta japonica]
MYARWTGVKRRRLKIQEIQEAYNTPSALSAVRSPCDSGRRRRGRPGGRCSGPLAELGPSARRGVADQIPVYGFTGAAINKSFYLSHRALLYYFCFVLGPRLDSVSDLGSAFGFDHSRALGCDPNTALDTTLIIARLEKRARVRLGHGETRRTLISSSLRLIAAMRMDHWLAARRARLTT